MEKDDTIMKNMKKRKRESENERPTEKNSNKKQKIDYRVKYIGETHKSTYERGHEHIRDYKDLSEHSHLLKHLLEKHPNLKKDELQVGMRVKKQYRTEFE